MTTLANFANSAVADLDFQNHIVDLIAEQYGEDEDAIFEAIDAMSETSGLSPEEVIAVLQGDLIPDADLGYAFGEAFDLDEDMADGLAVLADEAILNYGDADDEEYYDEDDDEEYYEDEDEEYFDEDEDIYYDEDEVDEADYAFQDEVSEFAQAAAAELEDLREFKEVSEFKEALDGALVDILNDAEQLLDARKMSPREYEIAFCTGDGVPLASYSTADRISTFAAACDEGGEGMEMVLSNLRFLNEFIANRGGSLYPEGSFLDGDEVSTFSQNKYDDVDWDEEQAFISSIL